MDMVLVIGVLETEISKRKEKALSGTLSYPQLAGLIKDIEYLQSGLAKIKKEIK